MLETKSSWCKVVKIGPRWLGQELHMDFVPVMCFQCDDPVCASFCPVNAIAKGENGIVVVDEEVCTGCKLCVYGCPYGAMCYDEGKAIAGKCDLCADRIQNGLEPACVQHCIGGSLQFVTHEELASITSGGHISRKGMICYASDKWRLKSDI